MARVAINGMGRIGRATFKLVVEEPELELVAVNDLVSTDNLAYLLQYDSVYGRYEKPVATEAETLTVEDTACEVLHVKDPAELPWSDRQIDIVFECTGIFRTRGDLEKHLQAGAQTVILSAPAKSEDVPMGRITTNLNFLTQPTAAGDRRALAQRDGRFGYQLCTGCTIESIAHPFAERLDGKGVYNGNRNTKCRGHQEGRCGPVVLGRAH